MTVPNVGMSRAGVPAIWGDVPLRNKNFTGRVDILARLREGASNGIAVVPEQNPDNPLPQAVQGLGGVGKTAIAIEYAHRYRSEYDLVWWIPADQLSSVRGALATLADRLHLDQPAAAGIDGAITAVLDALRRGDPYSRWLLIFDNADEPEDIRDLLPQGPGDVLITSRNHRWQGTTNILPMNVFARKESTEFLLKRVPKGLTEQDADRLAAKLGDLPLALEQAGAMLAETGMPADEYLTLLDEHVTSLMSEGKSPDYPLSMTAAWKLSVTTLQRRLPEAMELLRCCAFFGPEPIPRDVFRRAGGGLAGSPVAKVISNPILMSSAIRELGRYALVTLDGTSVLVHRLVQALLRDELTEEQRAAYRREAHLILVAAAPVNPDIAAGWPNFEELLPHVNAEFTELPKSRDPEVRDLARKMMRYLHQAGDYTSALAVADRFIEQWTTDSGPTNSDVLRAQRHRGNVLRVLGRYAESFRVTEEALASCRVVMGETEPTTLSLRTAFAADLRAQGRFEAARKLDEESRPLLEAAYGLDDSRTHRLVSSLALDYGLNSRYGTAGDLYDQAFRGMSPSTSDATAADVLSAWLGIAWTLRLLGKYDEAFDVLLDARDYAQSAKGLGPESLATLRSINAYTIVCRRLPDKREEALELARTAHEVATRIFGSNHPDTLAIAVSLSNLLRTISDASHPEALDLAEKTVDSYPSVYGDSHPYNFGCRSNLALLHRVTGSPEKARAIDELALAGLTRVLGPDHHFTLTVAMNLASDFAVLGLPEEARRLGEATLPKMTALLGPDHTHTLGCAANLALDLIATGDEKAGKTLQEEALESYKATQGVDFPDYVVVAESVNDRTRRLDPDFDPPPI
jgi:tetratricopeptide (TPR) repeat protein